MLTVKTPEEVNSIIKENFDSVIGTEEIPVIDALGRVLAEDIKAEEFVPAFNRSTVDGYAVIAKDCFGASASNSIILQCVKEIKMGEIADFRLNANECAYVPTGGMLPENADAVVMIEYTEDYGNSEIGILKSVAPSENLIYKGEDAKPGQSVLNAGRILNAADIGTATDMGCSVLNLIKKPLIGIISTGDELVSPTEEISLGQIRDVNSNLLASYAKEEGCDYICYGIVKDDEEALSLALKKAIDECDIVLISGGSSAGVKDKTAKVIESFGELFFHGIAIKPGKPSILGKCNGKPVIGLPGHPVAAYYISKLFVSKIIARICGREYSERTIPAYISENISANQGRALCVAVNLENRNGKLYAIPVRSKSGLIASIAQTDGFVLVPRSSEGVSEGGIVNVISVLK